MCLEGFDILMMIVVVESWMGTLRSPRAGTAYFALQAADELSASCSLAVTGRA